MLSSNARLISVQDFMDEFDQAEVRFDELEKVFTRGTMSNGSWFSDTFRLPKTASFSLGIEGIGFADESYGEPVTAYYFDEAVVALVASVLNQCSWRFTSFLKKNRSRVLQIVLTREGQEALLGTLSWDQMRRDLLRPDLFCSDKIGSGNEGDVYEYAINGQAFAVKLFSEETQRLVNASEISQIFRMHFPEPNFANRIGFAKRVVEEMSDWPKHRYTLSSLVEYAASQSYFVMELGPRLTVEELLRAAGLLKARKDESVVAAEVFMRDNSVSFDDIRSLGQELAHLQRGGGILRYCKIGFLGSTHDHHDFSPKNILVRGFDQSIGFDLILIDQGQTPGLSDFDPAIQDAEDLRRVQEEYDQLVAVPKLRTYLNNRKVKRPT